MKSLDIKLKNIISSNYKASDFIIADAKDADMAAGIRAPGYIRENNNIGGANPIPTIVTANEEPVRSHPSCDLASIWTFIPPIMEIMPKTNNLKL